MPAVVLPPEKPVFRLGAFGLTERELEVARHPLAGAEFNEVAARLGVSENTLKKPRPIHLRQDGGPQPARAYPSRPAGRRAS